MGTTVADVAATCLDRLARLALRRDDAWALRRGGVGERLGEVQLWSSARVPRVVIVDLDDPRAGMTSWMLHAFAPSDEPVPHLGMDVVQGPGSCALFVDLMPRVDLGVHRGHAEVAYEPLTPLLDAAANLPGLRPEVLPPRHVAVLSPWRLSLAGDGDELEQAGNLAASYASHWAGLVEGGLPEVDGMSPDALLHRDRVHRAAVVDPDLDPVWRMAERLLGAESVTTIRDLLANP